MDLWRMSWETAARRTKRKQGERAPLGKQLKIAAEVIEEFLAARERDRAGQKAEDLT